LSRGLGAGRDRRRNVERQRSVFINVPFDARYERLFVALIAGLSGLGLIPRSSLEIPPAEDRLRRIFALLRSCASSVHDLSRVQLARSRPLVPRFNMPFEAGLATALMLMTRGHRRYILEAKPHRMWKSLSDLGGTDPTIHGETVGGMLRAIADLYRRRTGQPSLNHLRKIDRYLYRAAKKIKQQTGDLYNPTAFRELVVAANRFAHMTLRARTSRHPPSR
jgi:hypothetical protein